MRTIPPVLGLFGCVFSTRLCCFPVYLYMCSDFSYKSRLIEIEEKPTS